MTVSWMNLRWAEATLTPSCVRVETETIFFLMSVYTGNFPQGRTNPNPLSRKTQFGHFQNCPPPWMKKEKARQTLRLNVVWIDLEFCVCWIHTHLQTHIHTHTHPRVMFKGEIHSQSHVLCNHAWQALLSILPSTTPGWCGGWRHSHSSYRFN